MVSHVAPAPMDQSTYDPAYFERLFAVEDGHFWFRARNEIIASLVAQLTASLASGYRVLEVGCGTGNVLRVLEKACPSGEITGVDLFAEGLNFARRRTSCRLVRGDVHALPFDQPFHLIGLFDVLEHLHDDMQALRDLHDALVPGGALLLTVPAHPSLWSYFDEASHHQRRYDATELRSKLLNSGYHVEYLTPYMACLFPLLWLGRRMAGLLHRGDVNVDDLATRELRINPLANDLLYHILRREARLVKRRKQLPMGASIVAIARRA